jgi:hypothetical protein
MSTKKAGETSSKLGSGAYRVPAKAHTKIAIPTGENSKESGPPRLYAPSGSLGSTSSQESGTRRLYVSPTRQTR